MFQYLASDSWVQFSPGPMKVFRPRLPTVNAAGYANELKFGRDSARQSGSGCRRFPNPVHWLHRDVVMMSGRCAPVGK